MAVAFTNNPELAGKEAAPGVVYQYVDASKPVESKPIGAQVMGGQINKPVSTSDIAAVNQWQKRANELEMGPNPSAAQTTQTPAATTTGTQMQQPPKNMYVIKGTPEERSQFEQSILQSQFNGINPHTINTEKIVQKKIADELPAEFERFFKGQVRYESAHTLDSKQQAAWNTWYQKWEANRAKQIEKDFEGAAKRYDFLMGQYDKDAAIARAASDKLKEAEAKAEAAKNKAPESRQVLDEKTGNTVYEEYRDGAWVRTGQVAKSPKAEAAAKPQDLLDVQLREQQIFGAADKVTGQIPKKTLDSLNAIRQSVGLQPYQEIVMQDRKGNKTVTYKEIKAKSTTQTTTATATPAPVSPSTTPPANGEKGIQLSIIATGTNKLGEAVSFGVDESGKVYWVNARGEGDIINGATRESILGTGAK